MEGKGVTTDLHTYSLTRIDPDNTKNTKKNKGKDLGLMKSINRPSMIFDVPTHCIDTGPIFEFMINLLI